MDDRQTVFNNYWSTRWVDFDNDTDTTARRKRIAFEAFDAGWSAALTDEVVQSIRAEARAELVNKIQPIVERMDCTCDCESGDSDHSYEICECDKCKLSAILADEPKEERGAEAGDIVAYVFADGAVTLDKWDGKRQYNGKLVILMRRAEVERRIEEAGR